jgi:Uri superfamily endonuclease
MLQKQVLKIGKLGELEFEGGYYAYIGSAMNGLEARITRHLRTKKKMFWHIDYLLKYGKIIDIFYKISQKKNECNFADNLAVELESIINFGSSDCNCKSHLFYNKNKNQIKAAIQNTGMKKYERKGVEGDEIKKDNWG